MAHTGVDNIVYVFDVDGVLCDIAQPINHEVLRWLARLLEKPAFVAINTGRGYDRVGAEIVGPIRNYLQDTQSIDRLVVVTEMGGVFTTFENGKEKQQLTDYRIPPEFQQRAADVYTAVGASQTMLSHAFKQSMSTFVKRDEVTPEAFSEQKIELVRKLREEFASEDAIVADTIISIDVHATHAGKNAGAKLIMDWVKSVSDIHHDMFVCLGDSNNDYEMARYFATQDAGTTFVFTGETLEAELHTGVEVIDTIARYSEGTLEYLSTLGTNRQGA